jgi:transposase-like protein
MKKIAEKDSQETVRMAIARGLAAVVRRDLHAFVVDAGMAALQQLLEDERTAMCGPAHARQPGRKAYRNGHAPGELASGGRRVAVRRPRARTVDGDEVMLPSWQHFGDEDPLTERAVEQMLVGVTTRRYERSLEPTPASVKTRGTSKSAVSRRFVAATEQQMKAWLTRDLSPLELAVIMIDGVHVEEHVLLVAIGIDTAGVKHVLGVREGATENATACTALLTDIVELGVCEIAVDASLDQLRLGVLNKPFHHDVRRAKKSGGTRFDGYVTRRALEAVLQGRFRVDETLADRLTSWVETTFGVAALNAPIAGSGSF